MNMLVTLAGVPFSWRFRDSQPLDAWLLEQSWVGRNEVRVVRVREAFVGEMVEALRRAVRAADDGLSGVRVREADPDRLESGLLGAIGSSLELPATLARPAALRATAERLAGPPTVFLVAPLEEEEGAPGRTMSEAQARFGPHLFGEAVEWADQMNKLAARVTVILLDTPRSRLTAKAFDLSVGLPADCLLADPGESIERLWRAYVHMRLAWEAAGDPGRAADWDRQRPEGEPEDDDALEESLNALAREAVNRQHARLRTDLVSYLGHLLRRTRTGPWLEEQGVTLEREGLLWRPPGETTARPSPWLARGLLLQNRVPEATFLLRGCLVCAPVAYEILNRCFDLESQQRAICWAARGGRSAPESAQRRFHEFEAGIGYESPFYPRECPARPDDAWPMTTFGEFLKVLGGSDAHRQVWYDLLNLRNFVAHGHYVGWAALRKLREIEQGLHG
jgi:hypothetical protein